MRAIASTIMVGFPGLLLLSNFVKYANIFGGSLTFRDAHNPTVQRELQRLADCRNRANIGLLD